MPIRREHHAWLVQSKQPWQRPVFHRDVSTMPTRDRPGAFVRRPGLFTTVQDLGRSGYQRYGVSVSGAMDRTALRIGNRIVGNPDGEAGLEATLQGPELEFTGDVLMAVTGADLSPTLNGNSIPMWTAVRARPAEVRPPDSVRLARLSVFQGRNRRPESLRQSIDRCSRRHRGARWSAPRQGRSRVS